MIQRRKEENQITGHTWNDPGSTGRTIDSKKDTETMNESEKRERFSRLLPLCQTSTIAGNFTILGAASNIIISDLAEANLCKIWSQSLLSISLSIICLSLSFEKSLSNNVLLIRAYPKSGKFQWIMFAQSTWMYRISYNDLSWFETKIN